MPLASGTHLGPYEITAALGAGRMGEVYKARDTKLDRDVAVKVLPASLARDPERLARFEREAKVLASLNHPNIAQIYGLQEADGIQALVMELVPGATLRGPVPMDQALSIAGQVAEALGAAHEKGITHRDLKPANVMITPEGVVKVLDFGLAAVSQPSGSGEGNPTNSPTLTISPTRAGMILGTAAYMSPEQARGQSVDRRADIWSFGVLLWEMLTGRQLFHGDTVSDILAGVLKDEPDFEQVPEQVRPLLRRCLQKEPKKRLRAIGDWDALLSRDSHAAGIGVVDPSPISAPLLSRLGLAGWIAAGVLAIAAVAFDLIAYRHGAEEPPRVIKTSVLLPEKATFVPQSLPAVSPDGRRLAFLATGPGGGLLWVRDLDSLVARPLAGTEGAFEPFWLPDSRSIGFFASGKLKKIEVAGGPALALCDLAGNNPRGGSWSKNDVILFAVNNSGLLRVSAAGGSATPATTLDQASGEIGHRYPWFLPDGHHFLYLAAIAPAVNSAVYVGDVDSKNRQPIIRVNSNAIYSPPGYLLFVRERTLMAQPFDATKLQTTGDAVPVAEQIDPAPGIGGQY